MSSSTPGLRLNIGEVGSCRELADECPIRVPKAHFAAVDSETHRFVLVLEDLGTFRVVDQLRGMAPVSAIRLSRRWGWI